jgi:hypothetical protein
MGDLFGDRVALAGDGNSLVVSAIFESSNATGIDGVETGSAAMSGAVYTFTRAGTVWSPGHFIKGSNTDAGDLFGGSIATAADGTSFVVGASLEDSNAIGTVGNPADNSRPDSGAIYVFDRAGSTWTQSAYLKSSNPDMNDELGQVGMLGKDPVAGATGESSAASGIGGDQNDNTLTNSGAVYVFE